jgi:outer membrane lipopolysaccharide assembly protein LptE/RlpB
VKSVLAGCALSCLIGAAAGCGYSTRALIGEEFHTIDVEILGNRTFRRDLEFALTQDIKDEILSRTNLRLVDRDRADVRLEGEILELNEHVLSRDRNDRIFESSVAVTVRFRLIDQRSGKDSGKEIKSFTLRDSAPFLAASGETSRTATQRTFSDLAEHLVYQLEEAF